MEGETATGLGITQSVPGAVGRRRRRKRGTFRAPLLAFIDSAGERRVATRGLARGAVTVFVNGKSHIGVREIGIAGGDFGEETIPFGMVGEELNHRKGNVASEPPALVRDFVPREGAAGLG